MITDCNEKEPYRWCLNQLQVVFGVNCGGPDGLVKALEFMGGRDKTAGIRWLTSGFLYFMLKRRGNLGVIGLKNMLREQRYLMGDRSSIHIRRLRL